MDLFQKHNIRKDVIVQYMRFLNSGGSRNSQTRGTLSEESAISVK